MQKLFYAPLILLMAYICWGCSADRDDFNSSGTGKDTRLTFSVSLPAKANTYSLDATAENNVSSIYVLAFKYQNSQYELADWSQAPESDIHDNGGSNKKKFTITFTRLKKGDSYKFVLLANAKDEVDALFQGGELTVGAEKNTTLQKVQLSGITHWNVDPNTDPSSSYRDIPMWGETPSHDGTGDRAVSQDMSITDLKLLRMVARINVFVDGEGVTPATSYFKLKSVDLYNTHQGGQVAPDMDHLIDGSMSKVKAPTVVRGSSVTNVPIVYDENMAGCTVSDAALSNTIYTFETEVPRDESNNVVYEDLTCLVIGGEFESDGKTTYYRVNLNKKGDDGKVTYLDVLRNHTYNIKIKGSGYDTSEEAFDAKAINMEAEVVGWDDGEVGEINESGGYRLALSPGSIFEFYRNGDPQIVNIKTDYPGGWKVVKVTEEDKTTLIDQTSGWLKVDKPINAAQGKDGSKVPMTLTVDANNTGNERVGYIYIQYANTKIYLTVTQLAEEEVSIEVTSNGQVVSELLFTSMDETISQKLDIKWSPKSSNLYIVNSAFGDTPGFEGEGMPELGATPLPGGTGEFSYNITPSPFSADEKKGPYERVSKLDLTTIDGANHASASVLVRHVNYGLSVEDSDKSYRFDGKSHTFTIKSNANWLIKSVTQKLKMGSVGPILDIQSEDNLREGTIGYANLPMGTPVKFTVANNRFGFGGTVKVVFASADVPPKFDDVEIALTMSGEFYPKEHGGWAGSNIYWDGTKLIFDDVKYENSTFDEEEPKQNQGLFFQWGSLWGVAPNSEGGWKPSTILYNPNGTTETSPTYSSWPQIESGVVTDPPTDKGVNDRAYLYEVTDVSGETGIGDICRYLTEKAGGTIHGKKWRMPTSNEFGKEGLDESKYVIVGVIDKEYDKNPMGTSPVKVGAMRMGDNNIFFPASGAYNASGESGEELCYWSSTLDNKYLSYATGKCMRYSGVDKTIRLGVKYAAICSMPVRCVVNTD